MQALYAHDDSMDMQTRLTGDDSNLVSSRLM